jgi:hypothetical protein
MKPSRDQIIGILNEGVLAFRRPHYAGSLADRILAEIRSFSEAIRENGDGPSIDGNTFNQERDGQRLGRLSEAVYDLMLDGKWRTFQEIQAVTGGSIPSISARLRDFRKARWGRQEVERQAVPNRPGLFRYRLLLKSPAPSADSSDTAETRKTGK